MPLLQEFHDADVVGIVAAHPGSRTEFFCIGGPDGLGRLEHSLIVRVVRFYVIEGVDGVESGQDIGAVEQNVVENRARILFAEPG